MELDDVDMRAPNAEPGFAVRQNVQPFIDVQWTLAQELRLPIPQNGLSHWSRCLHCSEDLTVLELQRKALHGPNVKGWQELSWAQEGSQKLEMVYECV